MAKKRALITGITGQDGSYLAELLMALGYEVHGLIRRSSSFNTQRVEHLYQDPHSPKAKLYLHHADISDSSRLIALIGSIRPDEIYNLAAQSHVRVSFDEPEYTGNTTALGTTRLLEAMRQVCPDARYYQASSSEMFGDSPAPQNESTNFRPRSPYGVSKLYSHWMTRNYREAYGLFAVNGILFNHESPRRGETFVTRKITRAVSRIKAGLQQELFLGNLQATRDWGYAPEYVIAMWRMLQQDSADDYVIGTGHEMSVENFVEIAFSMAGLDWKKYVKYDSKYVRPTEVDRLLANSERAHELLGWKASVFGASLVEVMIRHDLENPATFVIDKPQSKLWREILE
jgi:GDPmannose 4,6-dehydratase